MKPEERALRPRLSTRAADLWMAASRIAQKHNRFTSEIDSEEWANYYGATSAGLLDYMHELVEAGLIRLEPCASTNIRFTLLVRGLSIEELMGEKSN